MGWQKVTDWAAIGRKVADAAPLLGTALGGPAGAALGALVASTLGTASNPAEVMKKLQTKFVVLLNRNMVAKL